VHPSPWTQINLTRIGALGRQVSRVDPDPASKVSGLARVPQWRRDMSQW